MRLNRFLAASGLCARRRGDELIQQGQIQVNGQTIRTLGTQIDPHSDTITYQGRLVAQEVPVYMLLNKPKDCLCTTRDPAQRRTIFDLVQKASHKRLFSVGRLDRNTTGLILLTNDGALAQTLGHPSNQVQKIYQVSLDRPLTSEDMLALVQGIVLEDGPAKPSKLQVLSPDRRVLHLSLHMGRNRIIHRMFEHLGYKVKRLDRLMYGTLEKGGLRQGKWRYLSPKEVEQLKSGQVPTSAS